jgi:CheY-like chemotaxis protein
MKTHKWVLLIEDDANDADLIRQVLAKTRTEAEVVHVANGADALNCLYQRETFALGDKGPPSLVLLDLKMPRVDGFAVLEQIKGDDGLKSIPVAIFSSSREEADLVRSYHLGTNAYVVKPVNFEQFTDALEAMEKFWVSVNEPPPRPRHSQRTGATQHS